MSAPRPRRTPRYGTFIATGVVIGVLAAVVLVTLSHQSARFSDRQALAYLGLVLALLGGLGGGVVAVLLDRPGPRPAQGTGGPHRRRTKTGP